MALAGLRLAHNGSAQANGAERPHTVAHTAQPKSASADVGVAVRGSLTRGRTSQLQILVTNAGPGPSGSLLVTIDAPAGATLGGTLAGGWKCSPHATTLVCTHLPLASGGMATGRLDVFIGAVAPLGGRANAVVRQSAKDPNTANNRSSTAAGIQASIS